MGTSETRRTPRHDRKPDAKVDVGRAPARDSDARERILMTAYGLFSRHGINAVGVDTIIEQSDVAKMTLYRHFRSKDDLVLAVLERREELWTQGWLAADVCRRASDPAGRLLAIFDVFDGWFRRRSFEGCLFINALLEVDDRKHPIHQASREQLAHIRSFLEELARDAGVPEPEPFARQWHILMKGSIVAATEGDVDAALRAQAMGRLLLAHELGRPVLVATTA
jgi:AcrR family transcriptional regulator